MPRLCVRGSERRTGRVRKERENEPLRLCVRERDIEKTEEKERREERRASEWEVLLRAVVCGYKRLMRLIRSQLQPLTELST